MVISKRHIIEYHLSDNRHLKSDFILYAIGYVISLEGEFITVKLADKKFTLTHKDFLTF